MTAIELSIPFGLGLVSSLHCAQMCGPVVLSYSLGLRGSARARLTSHLAYHAGRLLTYSALGAVAAAAGGGMLALGRVASLERTASIVSGVLMLVAGLLMAGFVRSTPLVRIGSGLPGFYSRSVGRLLRAGSAWARFGLGLLMGLLPCGLLYAALIKALGMDTAWEGALSMLAFGLGTSGSLLGLGLFSSVISARLGRHANSLATASVLLVGAFLLYRGLTGATLTQGCHHGHSS